MTFPSPRALPPCRVGPSSCRPVPPTRGEVATSISLPALAAVWMVARFGCLAVRPPSALPSGAPSQSLVAMGPAQTLLMVAMGGALVLTGGHSMGKAYMDSGGAVAITGGGADVGEGGDVVVSGGFSTRGSSGTLDLSSAASGTHGVSGSVSISSGKSRAGTSGAISIETGQALEAAGGDIVLKVGDGRHRDGGNIAISAGQTSGSARTGGHVAISGGEGANAHSHDGGNGGDVELFVGEAKGEGFEDNGGEFQFISTEKTVLLLVGPSFFLLHVPDHHLLIHVLTSSLSHHVFIFGTGDVELRGGTAFAGYGGSLTLASGYSKTQSSGSVAIGSASSGTNGTSGSLALATGWSNSGRTGAIQLSTGVAREGGGGDISLSVGTGVGTAGYYHGGSDGTIPVEAGEIFLKSGDVTHTNATGGDIRLETGANDMAASGSFHVTTPDAGGHSIHGGNSGEVTFTTGNAKLGNSGAVRVTTGDSIAGSGGDIDVRVGQANADYSIGGYTERGKKGGGISLTAGETTTRKGHGGDFRIQAGEGSNEAYGGSGGLVSILGGASQGSVATRSYGGDGTLFRHASCCSL